MSIRGKKRKYSSTYPPAGTRHPRPIEILRINRDQIILLFIYIYTWATTSRVIISSYCLRAVVVGERQILNSDFNHFLFFFFTGDQFTRVKTITIIRTKTTRTFLRASARSAYLIRFRFDNVSTDRAESFFYKRKRKSFYYRCKKENNRNNKKKKNILFSFKKFTIYVVKISERNNFLSLILKEPFKIIDV